MKIVNIVALASIFLCMEAHSGSIKSGKTVRIRQGKKKFVHVEKDYDKGRKTKTVHKKGKKKVVVKDMNTQPDIEDTLDSHGH